MTHNRTWAKTMAQTAGAAVVLALVLLIVQNFLRQIERQEISRMDYDLQTMSHSNVQAVQYTFNQYVTHLQATATALEIYTDYDSPRVLTLLNNIAKTKGYERLAIDYASGASYTSDGHVVDISGLGYLDRIQGREVFIQNVRPSLIDGTPVVSILVPLSTRRGQPAASLRLALSTHTLTNTLRQTFYFSEGYYRIFDETGESVAVFQALDKPLAQQNIFDILKLLEYEPGYQEADLLGAVEAQNSGFLRYSYHGLARYTYYEPVGINNWMMLTILPKGVAVEQERRQIALASHMVLQLLVVLVAVFAYFFLAQRHSQKIAILNEKCFRAVAQQSNIIIFEWDYYRGQVTSTTHFAKVFGRQAVTKRSPREALDTGMVHPEDAAAFASLFTALQNGQNVTDLRFRVKDAWDHYQWCSLSGIVVKDSRGRPYRAIGYMDNIQNQLEREEGLKRKAERDALTGLYNKATTETLIRQTLETNPGGSHALFIIDIDNFKSVNDNLGHHFGDTLLSQLAGELKPLFRSEDIVGRVGGDEFFVFLKNIPGVKLVQSKAEDICGAFLQIHKNGHCSCTVSASVGIALSPEDGQDLETLYKHADTALYEAKKSGKNGFRLYGSPAGEDDASPS